MRASFSHKPKRREPVRWTPRNQLLESQILFAVRDAGASIEVIMMKRGGAASIEMPRGTAALLGQSLTEITNRPDPIPPSAQRADDLDGLPLVELDFGVLTFEELNLLDNLVPFELPEGQHHEGDLVYRVFDGVPDLGDGQ